MKKLCSVVAAGAMVAAGIVPSFAADVDWSGEVRVRYEQINNKTDRDKDTGDLDRNTSQRTTINAKVAVDDQTTAFISLRDARNWGEEGSTTSTSSEGTATRSDSEVGLSQGYLEIKNLAGPVGLKIGRQMLAYGNQRIIGHLEWSDGGRRFDAIKLMVNTEPVDVDLVTAKLSDNGNKTDDTLNILYATLKVIPMNKLDIYAIQAIAGGDQAGGAHDNTNFMTTGLRLDGKAAGADWTAEYAVQNGDAADDGNDISASAYAVTAGYTIPKAANLRIGVEVFSGSGDDDAADTDEEEWVQLYPTNHFHYGINDAGTNWENNTGTALKLSAAPVKGLKVGLERWQMEHTEDANGTTGVDTTETNIWAKYKVTEKTGLYVYYAMVDQEKDADTATTPDDQWTKLGIQLAAKF